MRSQILPSEGVVVCKPLSIDLHLNLTSVGYLVDLCDSCVHSHNRPVHYSLEKREAICVGRCF